MILLTLLFLYPLWHCVALSFGNVAYSNQLGFRFFPFGDSFSLASYRRVLTDPAIGRGYFNTVFRVAVGVPLTLIVTYMAAYSMAREHLPFKKLFIAYFIIPMFFSGADPVLPEREVSGAAGQPLGMDTARPDLHLSSAGGEELHRGAPRGAGGSGLHRRRAPHPGDDTDHAALSAPILAVLGLWSAVGHWNAWFDAMIYTSGEKLMVLQIVLRRLLIDPPDATMMTVITVAESTTETIKMASVVVALVPIVCVYPLIQKHFTKGVMLGAVKG